MTKMSRRLVVDASVARSAGTTEHPTSQLCRQFLNAMLTICHKVVMTDDIGREWRNHGSGYSISWLAAMQRRRKLLRVAPSEEHSRLINAQLAAADLPDVRRAEIEKDLLLVLAALASDRIVASLDDRMRKLLGDLAPVSTVVGNLVWVNPATDEEAAVDWLERGARSEPARTIRQVAEQRGRQVER
jgi:hypothetical protein